MHSGDGEIWIILPRGTGFKCDERLIRLKPQFASYVMKTNRLTLTQVCLDGHFRRQFHPFMNVHVL